MSLQSFSTFALTRAEMKNVVGGADIICYFTDKANKISWSGDCGSTNMDDCFSYAGKAANDYNTNAGYPGVDYRCE
ncbi:hypothetical protein [Dyadobacter tibetensis]|uniref:hypothetical protein n=1 Tax=Dyadobacter tibetensis TaxID=1211851 RepID=UPI0004728AA7|nr:hypothetical protein [Dyadobacter tibetensis]